MQDHSIHDRQHRHSKSLWKTVFGPPGTGKTSTLLSIVEREVRDLEPSEVAFVTFTRAAREEAKRRAAKALDCGPDDLEWFRTIHSTAFRLLGLRSEDIMGRDDLQRFADRYGYELSALRTFSEDDDNLDMPLACEDDPLMATLDWARSRMIAPERAAELSPFDVSRDDFRVFVERYTAWRKEIQKHDFNDLLERVVDSELRPLVRIAFVDEGQDLSPIQVKIVERWFADCERVYVAGDDDQAIYTFLGGDPDWLLRLAKSSEVQVLDQSYRVPALAWDMARQAIKENRHRVEKTYMPKSDPGELLVMNREAAIDLIDENETTFVLGRNWRILRGFAGYLRMRGVAFAVERFANWSPLGTGRGPVFRAWTGVVDLAKGRRIGAYACRTIFEYIPSGRAGDGLLPRGSKKRAREHEGQVDLDTLRRWGLDHLASAIERNPTSVLLKLPPALHDELMAIMDRYGYLPKPKVVLTSIHSSKGREADTVVILPEMSKLTYEAYMQGGVAEFEAENRVAYVAITRTKRRLIVCEPESDRHYPYDLYAERARVPGPDVDGWQHGD
jgi:superfamily I DNA/RNA helicase